MGGTYQQELLEERVDKRLRMSLFQIVWWLGGWMDNDTLCPCMFLWLEMSFLVRESMSEYRNDIHWNIFPCFNVARHGSGKPIIVVGLYHTFDREHVVPASSNYDESTFIVNCLFYEDSGILNCDQNTEAINQTSKKLKAFKVCTHQLCWTFVEVTSLWHM